jgi:hypothetical protein
MKRKMNWVLAVAVGLLGMSMPLSAHHGTAAFETEKTIDLKGTVVEWSWSNPHCLLQFDVKGDDGQVVRWVAETQNPVTQANAGWSKTSFKPGDPVTVTVLPSKNGKPLGRIKQVLLADGKILH